MDRTTFERGQSFEDYAADLPAFRNLARRVRVAPEDASLFSSRKVSVLVISESWCGDCKREVPLVARLAKGARWELRIFGRDANPDLMDGYTTEGRRKIPVIVFFDEGFCELGRIIESPPEGKTTIGVIREILGFE